MVLPKKEREEKNMKNKILTMTMATMMIMSASVSVFAEVEPTVNYEYVSAEDAIEPLSNEDLVLKNSQKVNGTTISGMTESYVYDEEKGKEVRSLGFNKKSFGQNKAGSTDVRAALEGFSKFMTDSRINTMSFDYKIAGTSEAHIGLFLVKNAEDYGNWLDPAILMGNSQNANMRWKVNRNTGAADWYTYTYYAPVQEVNCNNREWNRLTIEINKVTGDITGYMNGVEFSHDPAQSNYNLPTDMNAITFQTAGEVAADGDLAFLIDNIKVYPGEMKLGQNTGEGVWKFETGLNLEGFGIAEADGSFIETIQSEHFVKTTLSNTTEAPMSVIIFISGYKDGIMESVGAKKIEIQPGEKFIVYNENNVISLDSQKSYDRIQLTILDGDEGFPLMNSVEFSAE